MVICAELLHVPLFEFRGWSRDEQQRWRYFYAERNRRDALMHERAKEKAMNARKRAREIG